MGWFNLAVPSRCSMVFRIHPPIHLKKKRRNQQKRWFLQLFDVISWFFWGKMWILKKRQKVIKLWNQGETLDLSEACFPWPLLGVGLVVFAHVGIQVVTWGHPDYGADSSNVELKNVVQVQVPSLEMGPCSKTYHPETGWKSSWLGLSAWFFGGWVGGLHPPRSLTVRPWTATKTQQERIVFQPSIFRVYVSFRVVI